MDTHLHLRSLSLYLALIMCANNEISEASSPSTKSRSFISENFVISSVPNIPPCSKHHLSKEWLGKVFPGLDSNISHILSSMPVNLQIIPDSDTKITLKEKMVPVLPRMGRAKNIIMSISYIPVPPLQHILGVSAYP